MNIGRVQDPTIPTGGNKSDRSIMLLSESSTREEILINNKPVDPRQDTSQNMKFERDLIHTEYDMGNTYEQSNPPSKDEVKKQLDNLRSPQSKRSLTQRSDPGIDPEINWRSNMVENMDNVVTEDKITQGEFQEIMGLLAMIDSIG